MIKSGTSTDKVYIPLNVSLLQQSLFKAKCKSIMNCGNNTIREINILIKDFFQAYVDKVYRKKENSYINKYVAISVKIPRVTYEI